MLAPDPADARTDLFALGVTLYEMATGKKAFEGKSQAGLMSAIIKDQPPAISSVQQMTPPPLDRAVRRCLEKDPDERWQTAHDLKRELEWIRETASAVGAPGGASRQKSTKPVLAFTLLLGSMASLATVAALYVYQAQPEARVVKLSVGLPPDLTVVPSWNRSGALSLSPDGKTLAFRASQAGKPMLWLRPLDATEAYPLRGTEGGLAPFWSPDSRSLGFFSEGKLKKIDISGGPPQTICEASGGYGGAWSPEGMILFSRQYVGPLYGVAATGGEPEPLAKLDSARQENHQMWPYFLPDGRHFLFFSAVSTNHPDNAVYIGSLDSSERTRLGPADYFSARSFFYRVGIPVVCPRRNTAGAAF